MVQNVNSSDFFKELKKVGFEEVYTNPYQEVVTYPLDKKIQETNYYYLFFHKTYGILATITTTKNDAYIQQCRLYYNWIPFKGTETSKIVGGGEMIGEVWVAAQNVIANISDILNNLKRNGTLLPKWKYKPTLILLHTQQIKELTTFSTKIGSKRQNRIRTINNKIIAALPPAVKKSITPK